MADDRSHTIEHLSIDHLKRTINATLADHIYLDAPLQDHPTSWRHFTGSHNLDTGWNGVNDILEQHRYRLVWG